MIVNKDVLYEALNTWGSEAQMIMMIEECSELTKALTKFYRNPTDKESADVVEEIADVQIMLAQMFLLFGENQIEKMITYKLARLEDRLNG